VRGTELAITVAGDVAIASADTLLAPVIVIATVRVLSFATWALALAVTPVEIVIVQCVLADKTVVSVARISAAFDRPEFSNVGTNVVVPQLLVVGFARLAKVKPGSTSLIVSSNDSNVVSMNAYEIAVAVLATGLAIVKVLAVNAGAATAEDLNTDVSPMSSAAVRDADTLMVLSFSLSPALPVVILPDIVIAHESNALKLPPLDVNINVAVGVPELELVTLNAVEPQPHTPGVGSVENENAGNLMLMASPTPRATLSAKVKTKPVSASVTGFNKSSVECTTAVSTIAGDEERASETILVALASDTLAVLVAK
jgi:hypothetical protein